MTPYIELTYDSERELFSAPVLLTVGSGGDLRYQSEEMYVDTGSSISSVAVGTAEALGLDPSTLPRETIGGQGGFAAEPVASGVSVAIGGRQVELDKVRIALELREKVRKKSGKMRRVGERVVPALSLLGLDALRKLGARLIVDLSSQPTARIEWD